ncbi:ferritin family protein [Desulfosporosinus hippei]|uniref:Rubrerythrin n=1 Tax=Desulfosporosinus hippei DSM 8344 TaxID=1121419 RepID=A0A1G7W4W5_9FIRM|nr:ferritin family protein [Desulfosporosinus hippei]SDG66983.1 Rubrerythrin [Desulfosporosinus hippei DSM 8344]
MQTPPSTEIPTNKKVQLIKAQQGELDAVMVYRRLAEAVDDKNSKKTFLRIAADEGKHASILKKYTNETLQASNFKAIVVTNLYKILGSRFTLKLLEKGELKAVEGYSQLVADFPSIGDIIRDEALHANLLKKM